PPVRAWGDHGSPVGVGGCPRLGERVDKRIRRIGQRAQPQLAPLAPIDRGANHAGSGDGSFLPSGGRIDGRLLPSSSCAAPASARFLAAADTGRSICPPRSSVSISSPSSVSYSSSASAICSSSLRCSERMFIARSYCCV